MYHPLRRRNKLVWVRITSRIVRITMVFFTKKTVELYEVLGQYVKVDFRIVDYRLQRISRSYRVSIHVGSRSSSTGLKLLKTYNVPNRIYTESIDLQNIETRDVTIHIRMVMSMRGIF